MVEVDGNHLEWWQRMLRRQNPLQALVRGIRRTGKSTFFAEMAARTESVYYWNSLEAARLTTTAEVWAQLFERLGVAFHLEDDPLRQLNAFLDAHPSGAILVVDGWDQAVEAGPDQASDATYAMLDGLARFPTRQLARRRAPAGLLGLVIVTSMPSTEDVAEFARRSQRPHFERLSGLLTRQYIQEMFPFASIDTSLSVLREHGFDDVRAAEIADAAGGWFWLMETLAEAAAGMNSARRLTPLDYRGQVFSALDAAVFSILEKRPVAQRAGISGVTYAQKQAQRRATPASLGLPADFLEPALLAPAVRSTLARTRLYLDVESILMVHLNANAPADQVRENTGQWLDDLIQHYGLEDEDLCFVGVSESRITQVLGDTRAGERRWLPKEQQAKAKRTSKDGKLGGADDLLLIALTTKLISDHPLSDIVLLSGDADVPKALHNIGSAGRLTVHAPWAAGDLSSFLVLGKTYFEHTYPAPEPVRVSKADPGVERASAST